MFTMREAELAALNREFSEFYLKALEAQGLSTDAAVTSEGHGSGWMPFAVYFSLGMKYDHTAFLSAISCPVLIIQGEDDFSATTFGTQSYLENIENAVLETIPKAAHFCMVDQPDQFARIVKEFLEETK